MADVHVRRYGPQDAAGVRQLSPEAPPLQEVVAAGGQAWVAERGGTVVAYAFVAPLPGLPGQVELEGYVAVAERRQGLGGQLLETILADLAEQDVREVSAVVHQPDEPAAQFLLARGFVMHHEEWQMEQRHLDELPPTPSFPDCRLETLPHRRAIATFRRLYDESFADAPWYQPYSAGEVAAELKQARDLLFWVCGGQAVGFVWVHRHGADRAEIEPIGLVPGVRGRSYGRALLLSALRRLSRQGVTHVHLTVWRDNRAAMGLYEQLGFKQSGRRYHLAHEVGRA